MLLRPIAWMAHCVGADKTGKNNPGRTASLLSSTPFYTSPRPYLHSPCTLMKAPVPSSQIASVFDALNQMQQNVPGDISCQLENKTQPLHTFHSE
jgi:hypothetical protein